MSVSTLLSKYYSANRNNVKTLNIQYMFFAYLHTLHTSYIFYIWYGKY